VREAERVLAIAARLETGSSATAQPALVG